MDNKDWQKKGNQFWDVVQDALNSGDFQQLNQQVRETIDDTVEGIRNGMRDTGNGFRSGMRDAGSGFRDGMKGAGNGFRDVGNSFRDGMKDVGNGFRQGMQGAGQEWKEAWRDAGRDYRNRYQKGSQPAYQTGKRKMQEEDKQLPSVYAKNPPGQMYGTVMAITGYSLTGIFTLSTISSSLVLSLQPSFAAGIVTAVMGAAALISLGLGITGSVARGRAKRFREYAQQIGTRAYCTIEELSDKCGRKRKAVVKDLKKMIDKRMFLQGHLDHQETCVIVTEDMYQQYLTVQQKAQERQQEQAVKEGESARIPQECRKILEEGKEYIRYIQKCNDDIPGQEISRKLYRLEKIITRIFDEVERNPDLASDLRKFMNYYLPTTRKLVEAYRDMDREPIAGGNIEKTKKEIEDTLDTINQAFENLLDSFFEEKAWDISSDISVLHTMLAQEGLTKKDFAASAKEDTHE